jgi:hypothetical protein
MTMVFATMVAESSTSRRIRSIWMYDRSIAFADRLLFGCNLVKLFKQHTRLLPQTFDYLCGVLFPLLSRKDTNFRASIPIRNRIVFSLIDLVVIILYAVVLKLMEFMKILHLSLLGSFMQQL